MWDGRDRFRLNRFRPTPPQTTTALSQNRFGPIWHEQVRAWTNRCNWRRRWPKSEDIARRSEESPTRAHITTHWCTSGRMCSVSRTMSRQQLHKVGRSCSSSLRSTNRCREGVARGRDTVGTALGGSFRADGNRSSSQSCRRCARSAADCYRPKNCGN